MSAGPSESKVALGPPPRWKRCPRKGQTITGLFVPFKTPLCSLYDKQVPEAWRFYPKMMLQNTEKTVGLWIDLTNTDRFYSKEEVELEGARYVKLQCRGHGQCPDEDQARLFIQICKQFRSDHPRQLIGVHCTHGFNRTGFLIVSYLVVEQNWSVEAAVSEYARARHPGIYKADYLRELFARYGDADDTPPPPPLPAWCDESDPTLDDNESGPSSDGKPTPVFMDGRVAGVSFVSDVVRRKEAQDHIRKWCRFKGRHFPGCQPVSMERSPERNNLALLAHKAYKASWKADGVRYMMLIKQGGQVYMFDRNNDVFDASRVRFPHRKEGRHVKDTLLDGELIIDQQPDGKEVARYLIYDIVCFEGQDVGRCDFPRRLLCIDKELIGPRNVAIQNGELDRTAEPFGVRAKQFWDITQVEKMFGEKFQSELSHEIDGLVFQPVDEAYTAGRCDTVLKWKPPHLNSVDFKLQIVKVGGVGMLPTLKGQLFVLGLDAPFAEIKVTKALRPYDRKIVECSFENGGWQFMRERTDKSHPNALATALAVCNSINYPISKEFLLQFIEEQAVKTSDSKAAVAAANGAPRSLEKRPAPKQAAGPPPKRAAV